LENETIPKLRAEATRKLRNSPTAKEIQRTSLPLAAPDVDRHGDDGVAFTVTSCVCMHAVAITFSTGGDAFAAAWSGFIALYMANWGGIWSVGNKTESVALALLLLAMSALCIQGASSILTCT